MKKRILLLITLIGLLAVMTGCTEVNEPITSESGGIWNEYFVYPLSWLIKYFAGVTGESYGLSIIIVTIIIRTAILPLTLKQNQNSKAMQAVQPELQALKEKYSSKDQKTQQKLQEETMKLFQQHGVNPLAGCFPLLIQMPILIGFYHAIMRTAEIKTHNFMWFDLGQPDPFFILPLVAGVTTFLQQKLIMAGTANQNPQMAMMLWIMPIMIVIFAVTFPAALSLYWVVGNIFMIVQTYFIKIPSNQIEQTGGTKK